MIFAAGLGTRMGALTRERPKPLIEVARKPLIDHALDEAFMAGIETVVVNTHHHAGQLEAHLSGRGVAISHEAGRLLDTGGGLRRARPLLGPGPVFTMNSDAVWTGTNPLDELRRAWRAEAMEALLLLVPRARALGHTGAGDFTIGAGGRLSRGPGLVYSGAQIIRTERLDDIADDVFSLNRLWDAMLAEGRVFGMVHDGGWCDVGRPDSIATAEALLAGANDV